MLDVRQRQWHAEMLHAIDADRDLSSTLPSLAQPDTAIGQLRADVALELGLPKGIPVACGGGDNMMAAIGTGNVDAGRMTVSLGTSGTLFASTAEPIVDPQGDLAAFCSSTGGWLPLLCTMNCTVSTELTRQLFHVGLETFERCVDEVPPGSNGVMTVPFFNGERSPNLPQGKACLLGLDDTNYTQNNLLRSAMEAATYGLRTGLDVFRQQGCGIDKLRVTGGGASSAAWRQILADVFDLPVEVQTIDEGAALGAALQAMWLVQGQRGGADSLQALLDDHLELDPTRACVPKKESVQAYDQHYRNYLRHVEVVTPLYA
jgi:xylulokinase